MRTSLFTVLLVLTAISTFAQKKEIYLNADSILNDDLLKISESKFDINVKGFLYYNFRFDLDSLILNIKVQRVERGKISKKALDSIKSELSAISRKIIPSDNIIIINYNHGLDSCNSTLNKAYVKAKYKRFLKKLNKIEKVSQFFMYKSPNGINKLGKKINWIKDEFGTIEKNFFPLHCPCGSYVLIDENGHYYIQRGEYDIERIIDLLKDKKTTFAANV